MSQFQTFILGNQWAFAVVIAPVLLWISEAGYRIGLRLFRAQDEARRSQISGVQGAMLGLLGLLRGFTFSMAVNRFQARRAGRISRLERDHAPPHRS